MKPKGKVILYSILALVFLYVGITQQEVIATIGAIVLAVVSLYWIWKAKRK